MATNQEQLQTIALLFEYVQENKLHLLENKIRHPEIKQLLLETEQLLI